MPSLWLPGEVMRGLLAEREGEAEAKRLFGDFVKRLKAIDSRLFLVLCDRDDPENELRYGFWYIGRHNEDGTTALWEVHDKGAYKEPDDRVLEVFRSGDPSRLRSPKTERDRERRRREREKEHRKEFNAGERQARLQELADHRFRLQVPVSDAMAALGKKGK